MSNNWPLVKLGQVIRHRKEFIEIDDFTEYKRCRVQLHTKGIVLRDIVKGVEIKTKEQQVCRTHEFLVAEIDAKVGGFGIVPEDLEGAIVSSHYFLFVIDQTVLDYRFLDYFIRTPAFRDQVSARGSTNYAAIRPHHVLNFTIPLPPLDEQRRIVARIEQLAAKVEQARELRQRAMGEAKQLVKSALKTIFERQKDSQGYKLTPLNDATDVARGKFAHRPRNEPRFFGGNIPFIQIGDISDSNQYIRHHSQTLNEDGLAISRMFPKGTIVIAITGATIGVTGILDYECCFPDSIVGIIPHEKTTFSEYVYWALEYVKNIALAEATQTTQPNINLRILNKLMIPLPTLPEQRRIVAHLDNLQGKVEAVKRQQVGSAVELAALLPSILDRAFKGEL